MKKGKKTAQVVLDFGSKDTRGGRSGRQEFESTLSRREVGPAVSGVACLSGLMPMLICSFERWPGTIVRANRWEFCPASRGAVGDSAICCTLWLLSFAFFGGCIQIVIVNRHGNQNGPKIGISARRAIQDRKSSPLLALKWRCR